MLPAFAILASLVAAFVSVPASSAGAQPTYVLSQSKISALAGGFTGSLDEGDGLACSTTVLGDLDGDGNEDLAVGAPFDDDGGTDRGAVWILLLKPDGSVREQRKISDTRGGFTGVLDDGDHFGNAVAAIGDLDGDGTLDVAVGAPNDDDHDPDIDPDDPAKVDDGAIWILFLNHDGTVKSHRKIGFAPGGFPNPTPETNNSETAWSLAALRSDNGTLEKLAVGAAGDDDGGPYSRGAAWILTLKTDGTLQSAQKISATEGGFPRGLLDPFDRFGTSAAWLGDVDGDAAADLAVGAFDDDDLSPGRGAVWILFLRSNGTVKDYQKISGTEGGLVVDHPADQSFGWSLASPGDLDGNGVADLFVGETKAWAVHPESGAVRVLMLEHDGTVRAQRTIARKDSGLDQTLSNGDRFGTACSVIGDLDSDGRAEIAVGARDDDDGGADRGAVWVLSLDEQGVVTWRTKISDTQGRFAGVLDDSDRFGQSVAALGDVDGDGVADLAVGAPFDDDGGSDRGAVWILFLDAGGHVKAHRKISDLKGAFTGTLSDWDWFGASLAPLGDLNGDGVTDLAVGAVNDRDGGTGNRGAVWILFLRADGAVKSYQKISVTSGGFTGQVDQADDFGRGLATVGDLDGDGRAELAVGAGRDDDGGTDRGAVWILFLNSTGTVRAYQKISDTEGGFTGLLDDSEGFGWSVGGPGDVDGDGVADLIVGAPYDGDGGVEQGAAWVLLLKPNGRVKSHQKISATMGGLAGPLSPGDQFGAALAPLVDVSGDGKPEFGIGMPGDEESGMEGDRGALWLLSLAATGAVAGERKLGQTTAGFEGTITPHSDFGSSISVLSDLDGDGERDLVVGAARDDDGATNADGDLGAAWILFLGETTTTTTIVTTTTMMPSALCGDPSGDEKVTASDALMVLRAAVGSAECQPCICDADDSGAITASDALRVLRVAVGQALPLQCPACA